MTPATATSAPAGTTSAAAGDPASRVPGTLGGEEQSGIETVALSLFILVPFVAVIAAVPAKRAVL